MNTLTEKYNAIRHGTFSKEQFLRDARLAHPRLVTQFNSFEDAVSILKSKSMLFEEELPKYKPEKTPTYNYEANPADRFPIEAIERGIDSELEEKGLDSSLTPSEEDYTKAREKAISNIEKDVLFYLKKITGEKTPTKRNDVMTPVGKDNFVDKDNGLQKLNGTSEVNHNKLIKEVIKTLIRKTLNEADEDDSQEEPTTADSRPAQSDQEAKIKARNALNDVLPLLDSNMNLEDIADPSVLDMFLEALKDEILSRTEMDNLTQPDLNENKRRRFNHNGRIV